MGMKNDMRKRAALVLAWALILWLPATAAAQGGKGQAPGKKPVIVLDRESFSTNELIEARVVGMEGNQLDFITLVPRNAPEHSFGEVVYTRGAVDMTVALAAPGPGIHEIRVFHDRPEGKWELAAAQPVWVAGEDGPAEHPSFSRVVTDKAAYHPGEEVPVRFEYLSGHEQDWLTIVPKGTPADEYGEVFYTKGANRGVHVFQGLPETGDYEIRVYHDWPLGGYEIKARRLIRVREPGREQEGLPPK